MISKKMTVFLILLCGILIPGVLIANDYKLAMEEADAYLNNGQYLEAIGAYQELSEHAPDRVMQAKAILRIGDIYSFFLNNHGKALERYDTVKRRFAGSPYAAHAYFNAGMILYEKNRYREALEQFKTLIEKYPHENRKDAAIFMIETCSKPALTEGKSTPAIRSANKNIRVLLLTGVREVRVDAVSSIFAHDLAGSHVLNRAQTATIRMTNGDIKVNGNSPAVDGWVIKPVNGDILSLNGTPYRGHLRIQKALKGGLDVINILPLEAYLYGVVPKEMSPQWPPEALKAQAVASRTYALYLADKNRSRDYDVLSTTASQAYGGVAAESERSNRAVDETRGALLFHQDQLVLAYFHAHSGGITEDAQRVWSAEIPYLTSIRDDYSLKAPGCSWKRTIDFDRIRKALNKDTPEIDSIEALAVEDLSPSGRIARIRIFHGGKNTILSGNDFRLRIDPALIRSTMFTMTHNGKEVFFEGKGYGHGVGMSQWGAYVMAREGHSYRDILQYYYPGVEIRNP